MRETDWLLIGGLALFAAGATLVLLSMGGGDTPLLVAGIAGLVGATVCFAVASWRARKRVDWERVAAEQRLWESGPLGRAWLRLRQLLLRR